MRPLGISIYPDKSDTYQLTEHLKFVYKKAGEYLFFINIYVDEVSSYDEA